MKSTQTKPLQSSSQSQSYNELLNLRTTLLHMQYLYGSLDSELREQFKNQQRQHKDHLIQLYNISKEYEDYKERNFMCLLIVKVEEFLGLEQELNEKLLRCCSESDFRDKQKNEVGRLDSISTMIDQFSTWMEIKESEMQQSLCKLYLGDGVMLDLGKTQTSIDKIELKIDHFMGDHQLTLRQYCERVKQLLELRNQFKIYMGHVEKVLQGFRSDRGENERCFTDQQLQGKKSKQMKLFGLKEKYRRHVNQRLRREKRQVEERIQGLKAELNCALL